MYCFERDRRETPLDSTHLALQYMQHVQYIYAVYAVYAVHAVYAVYAIYAVYEVDAVYGVCISRPPMREGPAGRPLLRNM